MCAFLTAHSPQKNMQIFSPEWIAEFGHALNSSEAYRQQAQNWEGTLLLLLIPNNTSPSDNHEAVWLNLWHGECRLARSAQPADFSTADYILAATLPDWKMVLNKDIAPIMAIMRGKLKLQKGSMATLARYANAAKELVSVAADIPAQWDID